MATEGGFDKPGERDDGLSIDPTSDASLVRELIGGSEEALAAPSTTDTTAPSSPPRCAQAEIARLPPRWSRRRSSPCGTVRTI